MIVAACVFITGIMNVGAVEISPADGSGSTDVYPRLRVNFTSITESTDRSVLIWRYGAPYDFAHARAMHTYSEIDGFQFTIAANDEYIYTADGQDSAGDDDDLQIYNRSDLSLVAQNDNHGDPVSLDIEADNDGVYIACSSYGLKVYDANHTYRGSTAQGANGVDTDDEYIYTGDGDGVIRRYHKSNLSLDQSEDLGDRNYDVMVHDGVLYHTGLSDTICSYDAHNFSSIACAGLGGNGGKITAGPDRIYAIAGYSSHKTKVFDGPELNSVATLSDASDPNDVFADNRYVFVGDDNGVVWVYNATDLTLETEIDTVAGSVNGLAIFDDYLHIVSSGAQHYIYSLHPRVHSDTSVAAGTETITDAQTLNTSTTYQWAALASGTTQFIAHGPFNFTTANITATTTADDSLSGSFEPGEINLTLHSNIKLTSCTWSTDTQNGTMTITDDQFTAWVMITETEYGLYTYSTTCQTIEDDNTTTVTTVEFGYGTDTCPNEPTRIYMLSLFVISAAVIIVLAVTLRSPFMAVFAGLLGIFTGINIVPCASSLGATLIGLGIVTVFWGGVSTLGEREE